MLPTLVPRGRAASATDVRLKMMEPAHTIP